MYVIFIGMEYVGLNNLLNRYPNVNSYKKNSLESIELKGVFPQNKIDFEIPPLEEIEVVDGTSFRFVVALRYDREDVDIIGLYTSPVFYTEMVTSINENNPYFTKVALNPSLLVSVNINDITSTYNTITAAELELNVDMQRNIFLLPNNEYNFAEIIKYINWVVSRPALVVFGEKSVLDVPKLAEYDYRRYNFDEGVFEEFDTELNDIRISKLRSQLFDINNTLGEFEEFINNPGKIRLLPDSAIARSIGIVGVSTLNAAKGALVASVVAGVGLGSALGPIGTVIGIGVGSAIGVVRTIIKAKKNKSRQKIELEILLNKIKGEIRQLKERRNTIEEELKTLTT
jgi:hypothetical protein